MSKEKIKQLKKIYFNANTDKVLKANLAKLEVYINENRVYEKDEILEIVNKNQSNENEIFPKIEFLLENDYKKTLEIRNEIEYLLKIIFEKKKKEKLYEYLAAFYLIRATEILSKKKTIKKINFSFGKMLEAGHILERTFDMNFIDETKKYQQIKEFIKRLGNQGELCKHSHFKKNMHVIYLNSLYKLSRSTISSSKSKEEEDLDEKIEVICTNFEDYKLIVNSHRFKDEFHLTIKDENKIRRTLIKVGGKEKYAILNCNEKIKGYESIIKDPEKIEQTLNYLNDKIKRKEENKKNDSKLVKNKNKSLK